VELKTPELDRMRKVKNLSQTIGCFIEDMYFAGYDFAELLPRERHADNAAWALIKDVNDSVRKGKEILVILKGKEWDDFRSKVEQGRGNDNDSRAIFDFIESQYQKGIFIAKRMSVAFGISKHMDIEQSLADHFDIDLRKVEKEKRAILAAIRS